MTTAGARGQHASEDAVYNDRFDPRTYLRTRFIENVGVLRKEYPLREFNEFFKLNCSPPGMKVLDYGCGPTLLYSISAAANASELVLADYTENNRKALQLWVDRDPKAFDWTPYFDYVVQTLEGGSEAQAREREERMRKVVKAVVACNILQDDPIEEGYEGPYDIVTSSFCVECSCPTLEEYRAGIRRLSSLLKPGGKIAIYAAERATVGKQGSYKVGEEAFQDVAIDGEFVKETLERAGFENVVVKRFQGNLSYSDLLGTAFISATKRK